MQKRSSRYLTILPYILMLATCMGSYSALSWGYELPALPTPEDPQMATMLQRLVPDYRRWLDNPDGYIITPAQPQPWPCEVSESDKQKFAGVPKDQDPKVLASYAKSERKAGMKPGTLKPPRIENPHVYFLKGSCSSGKLDGDIELLAEYVIVINEDRSLMRVLSRSKIVAGERVGEMFSAQFDGDTGEKASKLFPEKKNKTLSGSFNLSANGQHSRGVRINYLHIEQPAAFFGADVDVTQRVTLTQPIGGDRWKEISYFGVTKIQEALYKGDKLHGKSRNFAYSISHSYSSTPTMMPASEGCYDEGEFIKDATCDVH